MIVQVLVTITHNRAGVNVFSLQVFYVKVNFLKVIISLPAAYQSPHQEIFLLQRFTAVLECTQTAGGDPLGNKNKNQIIESFKKKKRFNYIITIFVFAVAFFAFWYANNREYFSNDDTRIYIVYAICAATLGGLAVSIINWRCPSCNKYLGRSMGPKVCRKCGAKLQ
jgi:hypothetical protein